ncbi:MAG: NAD-binding protein [Candidatus Marinimicrobia bacterium]|nr:NAD-binding protein [Candidatus Neomarinimicrobiota bacterium]MCF7828332.1 NAD-binding protein [Candidatus Neomarinimicrobiota bacterium]MCF7879493.1 NAD-binding protein [Candidatus Neomarinimicrobiota bacterium]
MTKISQNSQGIGSRATNIGRILLIILTVILVGSGGYIYFEGWSFLNSLYMTIITLSTVGFREIGPLTPIGQIWTILLIVFGITIIGYTGITQVSRYLIEFPFLRERSLLRKIRKMKDHYIICGYGRMGRVIADDFRQRGRDTVIIENDPDIISTLAEQGYTYIDDTAVEDDALKKAGVESAKGLVAVLSTDADNLFVTLSARNLNPDLFILTRCSEAGTQEKMRTAGANKVVNPYEIGGHKMAQMVLSPHVDDFIEIVSRQRKLNLAIDQIRVFEQSELSGAKLMDTPIRSKFDTIITAILDSSNEMKFNPSSNTVINSGDTLICIGERDNLEQLELLARGQSA